ncbi:MAG: type II secretion system protein GspK [Pseudomonadota bacterium]|nr:type II secretion system protein GspK [Pseudomonadota bacterium]
MNTSRLAPSRPRGMALIAVLWIVAALSLMAVGLSGTVRGQITAAAQQRDAISGQAIGEAAMHLALQSLMAQPQRPNTVESTTVQYQGIGVRVELAPLTGLIGINTAGADLLTALLASAGGLPAGQAQALAQRIVQWRDSPPGTDPTRTDAQAATRPAQFEAPEDLLLVPGVDYALYTRLAPLISADLPASGGINPAVAPAGVQAALAGTGFLPPQSSAATGSTVFYRLHASVPLGEGKILRLTRDMALQPDPVRGLPWRTLREDRHIVTAAS